MSIRSLPVDLLFFRKGLILELRIQIQQQHSLLRSRVNSKELRRGIQILFNENLGSGVLWLRVCYFLPQHLSLPSKEYFRLKIPIQPSGQKDKTIGLCIPPQQPQVLGANFDEVSIWNLRLNC